MTIINSHGNLLAASSGDAAKPAVRGQKTEAESMAADFEAIFVRQMLSTMRTASLGDGLFDGQGTEQFRDMQDTMLAENMADKGVFGIAALLARHVEKGAADGSGGVNDNV
ncbi:MAG: rod-binding protein [Parasphingorhabdus sp.]|uniref:rod-binding protein n=1 Tax=Parasphingorhabdus sp. TaxID=2709688 RepID=UPI00329A536F